MKLAVLSSGTSAKKDILGNDEKRFAGLYYGLQERQKLTSTSAGRQRRTTSGRPISDSCPLKAAASHRAPCQSRPSLRISSAQLLDCSVGAPPAPDLPRRRTEKSLAHNE